MTTSSVSFRITRHAEDLAQTIHALSQRVVQLEQRLAGLEAQLRVQQEEVPAEQLTSLDNVDQLLRDCRELLAADLLKSEGSSFHPPLSGEIVPLAETDPFEDGLEDAA